MSTHGKNLLNKPQVEQDKKSLFFLHLAVPKPSFLYTSSPYNSAHITIGKAGKNNLGPLRLISIKFSSGIIPQPPILMPLEPQEVYQYVYRSSTSLHPNFSFIYPKFGLI